MNFSSSRKIVHSYLDGENSATFLGRLIDIFLIILIALNIISVILETVGWINTKYGSIFEALEIFSVLIFSVEYLLRIWTCVEQKEFKDVPHKRLKYAATPLAIIDLVAILPFYLTIFFSIDLRFLRVLRLLRIFKLTRYSSAMTLLLDVFREEANAFFAGFFILGVLLILAASGAYLVEHEMQPDKFGSIPEAMWWAMATLTTVGYGDVTPITAWGKIFGSLVAVVGIGMAALPAGILASGLADQLRRKREILGEQFKKAIEDGIIDAEEATELNELRKKLGLSEQQAEDIMTDITASQDTISFTFCPKCGERIHK